MMSVQQLSQRVLLITLPADPQSEGEMQEVIRSIGVGQDRDVIVDFSLTEILSSATLCNLMVLERLLSAIDRELILCSVPSNIEGIFARVGLRKLFRFAKDEFAALQSFDRSTCLEP